MTPEADLPIPTAGGAYLRNADGSLTPEAAAPAIPPPEDAPPAPGHANPEE